MGVLYRVISVGKRIRFSKTFSVTTCRKRQLKTEMNEQHGKYILGQKDRPVSLTDVIRDVSAPGVPYPVLCICTSSDVVLSTDDNDDELNETTTEKISFRIRGHHSHSSLHRAKPRDGQASPNPSGWVTLYLLIVKLDPAWKGRLVYVYIYATLVFHIRTLDSTWATAWEACGHSKTWFFIKSWSQLPENRMVQANGTDSR